MTNKKTKTDKFYVTTPIYYVNDKPHIGSAYTTLAADIVARYYREKFGGENVFFLTGTDEHGQKIEQSAKDKSLSPKEFADEIAPKFEKTWKDLNISYDFFIRTTDPRHEKVVSELLDKVYKNGYIYQGIYEGPYCVGCERFYRESELVNGRCPLHPNKEISHQKEKNYFLKLKDLVKDKVLPAIKNGDYQILPEEKEKEILSRIEEGVEDVSISREGVTWGIPVPWDKSQTIYVWVDALINYYSATQFLDGKERFWPADLHLVGKDILWFHAVIWQALLFAAELPIPKQVFAHGFFTVDGQKISKSLGNAISPEELVERYKSVDAVRYLLFSNNTFGTDGDISLERFDEKYNADLANGLGNLVSRIAKLCEKSGLDFKPTKTKLDEKVTKSIEEYRFDKALKTIWKNVSETDQFINEEEPWNLEGEKLKSALVHLVDHIRSLALNLKPFLPETSSAIEKQFEGPTIKSGDPLFPRIK